MVVTESRYGAPHWRGQVMFLLKPVAVYFGIVFGVGFILGPVRVLWVVPHVGPRTAELIEAPVMLLAITLAGWWVARRFCAGFRPPALLGVGLIAAGLVLVADIGVGVGLRGMSVLEVFTVRDSVSGAVYYLLIALFAVMPWVWHRTVRTTEPGKSDQEGMP